MNVLVIAAHPDDEVLGVGGTVLKHIEKGNEVNCLIMGEGITSRFNSRIEAPKNELNKLKEKCLKSGEILGYSNIDFFDLPDNRFDSKNLLDIVKIIEKKLDTYKPNVIYTHFDGDLNIDHKITAQAVLTACRPLPNNIITELLSFDTASATGWGFSSNYFKPNVFIDITDQIEIKLNAMSVYDSEIFEYPHPRSIKALKIRASFWGSQVGIKYAEAFQLNRQIIK